MVMCDPEFHRLEIVTGVAARRSLDDLECRLAAAAMQTSFAGGDIVGGLAIGIQQLGEAARQPRTLHHQPSPRSGIVLAMRVHIGSDHAGFELKNYLDRCLDRGRARAG